MDFTKATDRQLNVLIYHEKNIPKEVMKKIVEEAGNRKLFDTLIYHVLTKKMNMHPTKDLMQQGYIGIMLALKYYKQGDYSFKNMAYTSVKNVYIRYMETDNAIKRKSNKGNYSIDTPLNDDTTDLFVDRLIDSKQDVEKQVINKVFMESAFSKLTKKQAIALYYYSQGYSMNEIANEIMNIKPTNVHKHIHLAFKKINPERPKVSLIELGLTT